MKTVGKTIYQLTPTSIKTWENGNIEELKKLKTAEVSTNDIKIKILNNPDKGSFNPNPKSSGWVYDDPKRAKSEEYFSSWQYLGNGTVWQYQHWIHVRNEKMNFWGNYKLYFTSMSLRGTTVTELCYFYNIWNPLTATFYASYPSDYPNWQTENISDFYSTISIFDGSIGGTQYVTYTIYYAPGTVICGIDVTTTTWEVWCFETIHIILH